MIKDLLQRLLKEREVVLYLKVRPGAAKTELKSTMADGTIKMNVAAVPEDNKANKEIVRFFSDEFEIDPKNVEILFGQTSPVKRVRISL